MRRVGITGYSHEANSMAPARTRFFGISTRGNFAFFVFGAIVFGLVSLLVVLIRRSSDGQRIIAIKDSPVACASLGMNVKLAKLQVFAVSAALAGLGGALYGQGLQAVSPDSVQFMSSLTLVMLMVVAGLNSPGAAMFTGLFLGFGLNDVLLGKVADLLPDRLGWAQTFFDKLGSNTLLLVEIGRAHV